MTHLTPIVTEIGLFKNEGTIHFLDGNNIYFIMKERAGKSMKATRWRADVNRPKSRQEVDSAHWPKVPVCPTTRFTEAQGLYAFWMLDYAHRYQKIQVQSPGGWISKDPMVVTEHDFELTLKWNPEYLDGLGEWLEARKAQVHELINKKNEQLKSEFVPMREANFEESELVARIFSFDGDEKQLVQGLQRLGKSTEGLKKRNFIMKGFEFDNLEEYLFQSSRDKVPT